MGEHRLVPKDEVVAFVQHLERQVSLMHFYYTEINDLVCTLMYCEKKINQNFSLCFILHVYVNYR